jgi:hypothetical protein
MWRNSQYRVIFEENNDNMQEIHGVERAAFLSAGLRSSLQISATTGKDSQ